MSKDTWPSLKDQLVRSKVIHGSQLEKFIQENQDFSLLRPEEANDKIGLPHWLRVHWRKNHPEGKYSKDDPTGGYPRALKNLHIWMQHHQDNIFNASTDAGRTIASSDRPANRSEEKKMQGRKNVH